LPLSAGVRLGPYEILGAIGAGAMGEVYRARDTDLDRAVAIKVLPARNAADEVALGRFERESRLASSLNQPNILTIHAVGRTVSGEPYIAMELVDGRTLAAILAEGLMPMRQVADIAAQIAAGLASAHRAGVVHRDIKPQNVMVRSDGLVKIVDFGLSVLGRSALSEAETGEAAAQLSQTGVITGTISYMSPEQAAGRPLDFRSDQFSFGSVLYEMATGRRAFSRPTGPQTMAAIIAEPHDAVTRVNAGVPEAIELTIERCLAKDPSQRYDSTEDLARELQITRERLSGTRSIAGAGTAAPASAGRHWPWGATAAAAVVVAALALAPMASSRWFGGAQPLAAVEREQLAVLPFANVGNDPAGQAFVDGLIETLTSQLGEVAHSSGKIDVVPASDVRSTKVSSVGDARKTFGIAHALTGSVQRTGNHVRITANLVDARTLRIVGARTLDSELQDVVAMQDDTVRQIAELVGTSLQPAAAQALKLGGTAVTGAYESYLRGRGHLQRYESLESVDLAIAAFRGAIAADAKYALAHAALGEAYWRKYQLTKDTHWADEARASCDAALGLDDRLAAAHLTLGTIDVGTGKAAAAVTELSRVIAIDPLNADAHRELGNAYRTLGKAADAETSFKAALEIRPNSWANHSDLGRFYFNARRYADAEVQYQRVLELLPDSAAAYSSMGAVYYATKRFELAETFFRRSAAIQPNESAYSNLGTLYYSQKRYADAASMLAQASQLELSKYKSIIWVNLASALYWAPGEREKSRPAYSRALTLARAELRVSPDDRALLFRIADCQSRLGQAAEARASLARALKAGPPPSSADLFKSGVIYEQLGDRARALASIQKAIDGGYPRDNVERSPDLAKLRADARFAKR
jgi:serine/threonine-protein kinase